MKVLKVSVSDEAWPHLEAWFQRNGVTAGALLEAWAERVVSLGTEATPDAFIGHGPTVVRRAQEIAVARRRRAR